MLSLGKVISSFFSYLPRSISQIVTAHEAIETSGLHVPISTLFEVLALGSIQVLNIQTSGFCLLEHFIRKIFLPLRSPRTRDHLGITLLVTKNIENGLRSQATRFESSRHLPKLSFFQELKTKRDYFWQH